MLHYPGLVKCIWMMDDWVGNIPPIHSPGVIGARPRVPDSLGMSDYRPASAVGAEVRAGSLTESSIEGFMSFP